MLEIVFLVAIVTILGYAFVAVGFLGAWLLDRIEEWNTRRRRLNTLRAAIVNRRLTRRSIRG